MRRAFLGLICAMAFSPGASAQICNVVPNNLSNGTTADATQVMANFNYVLACVANLRGYIGGLTMSNDATSPTTILDTSVGTASAEDNVSSPAIMTLASPMTKNATVSWSAGSGGGCLDTGTVQASTWYNLFLIGNTTTDVVDELCSTNPTSPALPSGYTRWRRIGSFKTSGGSTVLAFTQIGDQFLWPVAVRDVASQNVGSSLSTLTLASVPPGVPITARVRVFLSSATASGSLLVASPYESATTGDNTPAGNLSIAYTSGSVGTATSLDVSTDTNQISAWYNSGTATINVNTYGWTDTRGRFN